MYVPRKTVKDAALAVKGGETASMALAPPMLVRATPLVIKEMPGAVVPDASFLESPTPVFGLEDVPVIVVAVPSEVSSADTVVVAPLLSPVAPSHLGVVAAVDPSRTVLFPMEVAECQSPKPSHRRSTSLPPP